MIKNISNRKNNLNNKSVKPIISRIYLLFLALIILSLVTPQVYAATYTSMYTIPSSCTGGSITSDSVNGGGGRIISCSGTTGNLTTISYNKPGDTSPQYFEMNKQTSTGSGVQICLLGTCISNNGYAKSPNFPISNGVNATSTGTISLTTTPGGSSVTLNGNNVGTTSAGASGTLNLQNVPAGINSVVVSLSGYQTSTNTVSVTTGQTTPLNVVLQQNQVTGTTYTNMRAIPSTCNGGSITSDSVNGGGGRAITCTNGGNSLGVTAYNKPGDTNPQYFEMYKQNSIGSGLQVCLLTTCVSNNGFAISPNFPIIGNSTGNSTNNSTNTTNPSTGSITLTTQPGGASITMNGNSVGTTDPLTGALMITNAPVGNDAIVASKTNYANGQVSVSVTTNQTSTQFLALLNTNPANQPPQAPVMISPNSTGVLPNDFLLETQPAVDAENDAIIAADYEIWDMSTNQVVFAANQETANPIIIDKANGVFVGSLAGSSQLLYNHSYETRARFYENAQFNNVSSWSAWDVFQTINVLPTVTSWTPAPGYAIQKVASNVSLPVNVEMAPNLYTSLPLAKQPLLYVTQLYGQIGVILHDGTYVQYAGNLLTTPPPGGIPGGGEAGVDGLYIDNVTGDVYADMSYTDNTSITGMSAKVMHFKTNAAGTGFTSSNVIIDKIPVRPSHEAHTILKGPDGKMYISVGDADQTSPNNWPLDPTKFNGKVLRLNWDGSMPTDNPFNNTYSYAIGFRNPFGMAFRPGTNELYVSNNGLDTDDGFYKTFAGSKFGWFPDLVTGAWVNWHIEIAPTQVAFDTANAFPSDTGNGANNVYVVGSGNTYLQGPSSNSKRIFQIPINPNGSPGTQTAIATYTGSGYGDPIGLAFAPDGAYFTDIYGDAGFTGAGVTQGNIYKIVWTGQNSTNQTNTTGPPPVFSTVIAQHPWYPQGLNMIWDCKPTGGSGNYTYDFVFGDGNQLFNLPQNNAYITYPSHGTYNAGCTVHDLSNGQQTSASTTLTI